MIGGQQAAPGSQQAAAAERSEREAAGGVGRTVDILTQVDGLRIISTVVNPLEVSPCPASSWP